LTLSLSLATFCGPNHPFVFGLLQHDVHTRHSSKFVQSLGLTWMSLIRRGQTGVVIALWRTLRDIGQVLMITSHSLLRNQRLRAMIVPARMRQCRQPVYIYTKFEKFGIFSKCLIYKFLIRYIQKIWYIFDGVLFEFSNQIICHIENLNRENIVVLKVW